MLHPAVSFTIFQVLMAIGAHCEVFSLYDNQDIQRYRCCSTHEQHRRILPRYERRCEDHHLDVYTYWEERHARTNHCFIVVRPMPTPVPIRKEPGYYLPLPKSDKFGTSSLRAGVRIQYTCRIHWQFPSAIVVGSVSPCSR
ncbi:hypothetical protein BC835DRAFT_1005602 [Cytidiella melzeri]|nr:hypothetical protein BC835DRAFT_1005602 [Cytidiella melzeri]